MYGVENRHVTSESIYGQGGAGLVLLKNKLSYKTERNKSIVKRSDERKGQFKVN